MTAQKSAIVERTDEPSTPLVKRTRLRLSKEAKNRLRVQGKVDVDRLLEDAGVTEEALAALDA